MPGDTISGMSSVNTYVTERHFRISKIFYCLEKITILPNLWSISFIGNGSLFFITQYSFYATKEDGLVAVNNRQRHLTFYKNIAIRSLYRHVVCNVPVSCKAYGDMNQLWAWLMDSKCKFVTFF